MKRYNFIKYFIALIVTLGFFIGASAEKLTLGGFTVVIDAGHGGHDTGAVDNGVREKDVNLGVAKKLAEKLKKKMPSAKVVMTREDDRFLSLQERADVANRNKGNLFISIHTNSVDTSNPNRKSVSGANVYALGLNKDDNNLQVARRENSVIEMENDFEQKYSGFDPSKDESYIIFEMAQKKNLGQSLKFANFAQKHLVSEAGRKDRGVKQAGFWVLWATSMPAVLVELDFICNPTSADFISSEKGQDQLAEALFNAIDEYRNSSGVVSYQIQGDSNVAKPTAKSSNASKVENKAKQNTNKGKNGKGGNLKKKGSDKNSALAQGEVKKDLSEDEDSINKQGEKSPLLLSSKGITPKKQHLSSNENKGNVRNRNVNRKRRSAQSKLTSDSRELCSEEIKIKSEGLYLAQNESNDKEANNLALAQPSETQIPEKNKSKDNKKKSNDKNRSKKRSNDGKTHIIVASDGSITTSSVKNGATNSVVKRHVSRSSHKTKTSKLSKVFKIQVLASEEVLSENSPCFHGFKPITSFQENSLYKYTYGESTSRDEIEQLLLEVKKAIPDAFIITALK